MIVLCHAYFLHEDAREKAIMKPYPPLGILYISAWLEHMGVAHDVFDTTFSSKEIFYKYLLEKRPPILAIYINLMTKINVLEIIRFVRSNNELAGTKIILGGPDVRYNAENLLGRGADFLVIGEGEETFYELSQSLTHHTPYEKIPGIAYPLPGGGIHINEGRTLRKDLDELPVPNRKKIDFKPYLDTWKQYHGNSAMTVSTMRGCPYSCHWCSRGVYGKSYRRRSAESVVAEIKHLQETYNPDNLWFVDDVFTISHKWLQSFVDALKAAGIKPAYECITRADRLNAEVIQLLKESGCFRVWIGAESGSQKIIDLMDRRVDVQMVQQMIQMTQHAGIQAGTFIMVGYPGETEDDIKETLRHLKASNPGFFTITITYPIKGTELYTEVEAVSTANKIDWSINTDRDIDFERAYSKKYYEQAIQWIVSEMAFYQRKTKQVPFLPSAKNKIKSVKARMGMWWYK
ncbi:MAG: radical SAM protein [Bacteroidota bacterium]